MKRSKFIKLSSAGSLAIAIPSLKGCRGSVEYPSSLSQPGTITRIRDPQQIQSIGNAYLERVPDEANRRTLVLLLSAEAPADSTAIPEFMKRRIAHDFENGNTVMVDGWIISQTEARQCALYSLEQNN